MRYRLYGTTLDNMNTIPLTPRIELNAKVNKIYTIYNTPRIVVDWLANHIEDRYQMTDTSNVKKSIYASLPLERMIINNNIYGAPLFIEDIIVSILSIDDSPFYVRFIQ